MVLQNWPCKTPMTTPPPLQKIKKAYNLQVIRFIVKGQYYNEFKQSVTKQKPKLVYCSLFQFTCNLQNLYINQCINIISTKYHAAHFYNLIIYFILLFIYLFIYLFVSDGSTWKPSLV